jgi:hypothetical protein
MKSFLCRNMLPASPWRDLANMGSITLTIRDSAAIGNAANATHRRRFLAKWRSKEALRPSIRRQVPRSRWLFQSVAAGDPDKFDQLVLSHLVSNTLFPPGQGSR